MDQNAFKDMIADFPSLRSIKSLDALIFKFERKADPHFLLGPGRKGAGGA